MLDYTKEAADYDETRGGVPRAEAAASAVLGLVPRATRTLLDVACGTGIVPERLARPGLRVSGVDPASGMARRAAERLPGAVVIGDGRQLPFPDASFDAVSAVWLLHLVAVAEAERIVGECARVLRPGGVFVTTVDKDAGHDVGSDIDAVFAPHLSNVASDRADLIEGYARACGLEPAGEARFPGHGQGRSALRTAAAVRRGHYVSRLTVRGAEAEQVAAQLEALPEPDRPRADPVYRLSAFRRPG
ncbi:class I SAM-dependent methyltransferase [Streptomyces sp. NBC_01304]|uniref:class I SAM-dependent methyltransferase n=1 Tax=Streptomyces sp. NBC_01304 TaxID=2903818 RepID=UPI002E0D17A2|nr:class I SAM-dependent methyltransferase [Streptomyces sp. NBC_01304]